MVKFTSIDVEHKRSTENWTAERCRVLTLETRVCLLVYLWIKYSFHGFELCAFQEVLTLTINNQPNSKCQRAELTETENKLTWFDFVQDVRGDENLNEMKS